MPRKGHTEEQIMRALREAEGGKKAADICREMGVSAQAFYSWKRRFAGLGLSELRELRQLREEYRKLKTLVADLTLDKHILREVLSNGYAIAQLIQQLSDDLLRIEEGSLYPALQRLEMNGWIDGEWGLSANNRRARFYKLTPEGRKHLIQESARYRQVTGAVAGIIGFA